jgi:hypothetical protein
MRLEPNPQSAEIMLVFVDDASDIHWNKWTGSAFTAAAGQAALELSSYVSGRFDVAYTDASGIFISTVHDAGAVVASWDNISWDSNVPSGTSITMQTRTGGTATPDATWSAWQTCTNNQAPPSPENRYIQYRAILKTDNIANTPRVDEVRITYTLPDAYSMDINMTTEGTPSGASSYVLQLYYRVISPENDTFRVQVYDNTAGTWNYRGDNLTASAWTDWSYTLESSERAPNGDVKVKFVDNKPSATVKADLQIDYLRVRSTTYRPSGYLLSSWYDSEDNTTSWGTLIFNHSLPSGTSDNVYVQVDNDNTVAWTDTGNGPFENNTSVGKTGRYVRYKVYLETTVSASTPTFSDISIAWSRAGASWVTLRISSPLNENMSYDSLTRDNANVLYSPDGVSWVARENQPIYVLDVDIDADGVTDAHEGNPYDENDVYSVYADNRAGVYFAMSGEVSGKTKVTKGAWVLVRRVGSPTSNLEFSLYDVTDGVTVTLGTVAYTDLPTTWTWRYVSFENVLAYGRTYRFALASSGGSASDCYQWMTPRTSLSMTLTDCATYDGTNTVATYNTGGGWTNDPQRDAILRFKVADNFRTDGWLESSVYDAGGAVTWKRVKWNKVTSAGTSVRVYFRTNADDNDPTNGGWSDWTEVTSGAPLNWENRYAQYRVVENTTDESTTPVLQSITIAYITKVSAPKGALIQTWVQTTQMDFLGGREPKDIGDNVQVISPGDLVLKASGYWGNEFYGTSSSTSQTNVNDPSKMISMSFVAQENENLQEVRIFAYWNKDDTDDVPTDIYWRLQIRTDNNGRPSDNVIGENGSFRITKIEPWTLMSTGFRYGYQATTIKLPPLPLENKLVKGETYHLVISVASGTPNSENRVTFVTLDPRHADNMWLNNSTTNENRNVLFSQNGGGYWEVVNREPVYVLVVDRNFDGDEDAYEGNSAHKTGIGLFLGDYPGYCGWAHGQHVVVDPDLLGRDMNAAAVEFLVQRVGSPHDVHIGIDGFREETLVTPIDIAEIGYNWLRCTFKSPRMIWENDKYDIYLKSPWSDISNYIEVLTMDTRGEKQYTRTTYGGTQSYQRYSFDGVNWISEDKRDIPFRFVTGYRGSGTFESKKFDAGQVVDWQYIEWDATEPPGTRVEIDVLAGGVTLENVVNGASLAALPNSRYIQYRVKLLTNSARTAAPAVHEVRIGYRGGFGSVRLQTRTQQYPQQEFVYEGNASIIAQDDKSVMFCQPKDMIVVSSQGMTGDNLKVTVNYHMIKRLVSGVTGGRSITLAMGEKVYTVENKYTDKVEVIVVSDYAQAWEEYFMDVARQLNHTYGANFAQAFPRGTGNDVGEVKLTIYGKLGDSTKDIYYFETVTEYEIV